MSREYSKIKRTANNLVFKLDDIVGSGSSDGIIKCSKLPETGEEGAIYEVTTVTKFPSLCGNVFLVYNTGIENAYIAKVVENDEDFDFNLSSENENINNFISENVVIQISSSTNNWIITGMNGEGWISKDDFNECEVKIAKDITPEKAILIDGTIEYFENIEDECLVIYVLLFKQKNNACYMTGDIVTEWYKSYQTKLVNSLNELPKNLNDIQSIFNDDDEYYYLLKQDDDFYGLEWSENDDDSNSITWSISENLTELELVYHSIQINNDDYYLIIDDENEDLIETQKYIYINGEFINFENIIDKSTVKKANFDGIYGIGEIDANSLMLDNRKINKNATIVINLNNVSVNAYNRIILLELHDYSNNFVNLYLKLEDDKLRLEGTGTNFTTIRVSSGYTYTASDGIVKVKFSDLLQNFDALSYIKCSICDVNNSNFYKVFIEE